MKDLLVFLAEGFEDIEALTVVDYLRRANLEVDLVSITNKKEVKSAHNIIVLADYTFDEIRIDDYKGAYIPGGLPGAVNLAENNRVKEVIEMYNEKENLIAAICAGPLVLDRIKLLAENKFTCYPGYERNLSVKNRLNEAVVINENIVTSMGPSFAQVLAFELIRIYKGEEEADKIKKEVLFSNLVEFIRDEKVK